MRTRPCISMPSGVSISMGPRKICDGVEEGAVDCVAKGAEPGGGSSAVATRTANASRATAAISKIDPIIGSRRVTMKSPLSKSSDRRRPSCAREVDIFDEIPVTILLLAYRERCKVQGDHTLLNPE